MRACSTLVDCLKSLRIRAGFKDLESIAKATSTHKNTVGRYESGARVPGIDYLMVFCDVTSASLKELLLIRAKESDRPELAYLIEAFEECPGEKGDAGNHTFDDALKVARNAALSRSDAEALVIYITGVLGIEEALEKDKMSLVRDLYLFHGLTEQGLVELIIDIAGGRYKEGLSEGALRKLRKLYVD